MLFPGHFHVHVTVETRYDPHLGSPENSTWCFTASTATTMFVQKSLHGSAPADLRLSRRRFGLAFIAASSGAPRLLVQLEKVLHTLPF